MIPHVTLEHLSLSRMVCGTNQFVGITHRASGIEIMQHLYRFRSEKTVASYLIYLIQNHGVNYMVSSPRDKLYKAKLIAEKETGIKFHWLCTPSRRRTAKDLPPDIFTQINWCADHDVSVCMPHRDYTDHALDKKSLDRGQF